MIEQTRVHFDSGGVTCVGYLHRSTGIDAPRPCMVLAIADFWTRHPIQPGSVSIPSLRQHSAQNIFIL
ncbi:hypothetical protein [Methanoculleus sp.]|uniref:hypothetical protein n=1 Tax=Methanoculleus sp. TaxID=90427 RepID=UPI001BD2C89F|nr:hypothetical protein [Methanoculleus sp.]